MLSTETTTDTIQKHICLEKKCIGITISDSTIDKEVVQLVAARRISIKKLNPDDFTKINTPVVITIPNIALPIRRSLDHNTSIMPIKILMRCNQNNALRGLINGVQEFMDKAIPTNEYQPGKPSKRKTKGMLTRFYSTLPKEPIPTLVSQSDNSGSIDTNNYANKNVRFLTGSRGIGKSNIMKELIVRTIYMSENARIVYIANCEEWANQYGWEGQLEYFVTAIMIAFGEDNDFKKHLKLEFTRGSNEASMCGQVLDIVRDYCRKHSPPLRLLFCLDNYDALLRKEVYAHKNILQLTRTDSNYFYLVLATSRNQIIPDFVSMQLRVPAAFSKAEIAGITKHFANPIMYMWIRESKHNRTLFFELVRRLTENNPREVFLLLFHLSHVDNNDAYYNDLLECAIGFQNNPINMESGHDIKDYVISEANNTDDLTTLTVNDQKLITFCAFNRIYFNAASITNEKFKREPKLLFHPHITPQRYGIDGNTHVLFRFNTPRTGNFAMKLAFGNQRNGIIEVSEFFGNGSEEKYYMGYAGLNLLIKECELDTMNSNEFRFHSTQMDMYLLHIKDKLLENQAIGEIVKSIDNSISYSGIGSVAFYTFAMYGGIGPSKGMDFALKYYRAENIMAYIICALYLSGADVNYIIDSIEKKFVNSEHVFREYSSAVDRILSGINTIIKTQRELVGSNSRIIIRLLTSSVAAKNQRWKDLKIIGTQLDFMAVSINTTLPFADVNIVQFQ